MQQYEKWRDYDDAPKSHSFIIPFIYFHFAFALYYPHDDFFMMPETVFILCHVMARLSVRDISDAKYYVEAIQHHWRHLIQTLYRDAISIERNERLKMPKYHQWNRLSASRSLREKAANFGDDYEAATKMKSQPIRALISRNRIANAVDGGSTPAFETNRRSSIFGMLSASRWLIIIIN